MADLLLHVIDAADPLLERQMQSVEKVLRDLELDNKPRLLVFNKCGIKYTPWTRFASGRVKMPWLFPHSRETVLMPCSKAAAYLWPDDSAQLFEAPQTQRWEPSLD